MPTQEGIARMKSAAELRAMLREAEKREADERKAAKERVKPRYTYHIAPADTRSLTFRDMWDDSIKAYTIKRTCKNADAMKGAGWDERDYQDARMSYLYNPATHKIIMEVGGGTRFFADSSWSGASDTHDQWAADQIGAMLAQHPDGCDVTQIISQYESKREASRRAAARARQHPEIAQG